MAKEDSSRVRILSWNVNGLRSILGKGLADAVKKFKPDALCLQEIKAFAEDVPQLGELFPDYQIYFGSAEKPGYSGVATFLKKSIVTGRGSAVTSLLSGCSDLEREGRVLMVPLEAIDLYNLYFPSGTSGESRQEEKYRFLDAVLAYLAGLPPSRKSRVVLVGDFNICHQDIDIHHPREAERRKLTGFLPEERAWMDKLVAAGFVDTYRQKNPERKHHYTWWTYRAGARGKNLGWRIDYQFVSTSLSPRVMDAEILSDVLGSDHCPTLLDLAV